jgi:hypothetical protein
MLKLFSYVYPNFHKEKFMVQITDFVVMFYSFCKGIIL